MVLPDPGTQPVDVTENERGSAAAPAGEAASAGVPALAGLVVDNARPGMSNAVVISAAKSKDGHPIAVFGPQTGYFAPRLLMLQELNGPGIRARGRRVRRAQQVRAARPGRRPRLERDEVPGALPYRYCGDGTVAGCRAVLLDSLAAALAEPATTTYPGDDVCAAGDQWCADAVRQSPLGGVGHPLISWQNRPTYQQVVSFPARRGDPVGNLAKGATATASSRQNLLYPAGKAVDGDPSSRWSSASSDNQWIQVDLGAARSVARVILRWEAAYGKAYAIQTSTDGATWTTVHATEAGDGGVDNIAFTPVDARYVRMQGVRRGTSYGYSLYEFEIYAR